MTLRSFVPSLIALLSLSACTADDCGSCGTDSVDVGNDDTQDSTADTACSPDCDTGDDTGTAATGSFTAPMILLPDGTLESSTSNLVSANMDYAVPSGTTEDVVADDYDMTLGDLALATDYSDSLPVSTVTDGTEWIAPSSVLTVDADGTIAPEAQTVSRYVGGQTWTCNEEGGSEATSQTTIVYYVDNDNSLLIGINGGEWGIDGDTLYNPYSSDECKEMYGSFINATQFFYYVECVDGDVGHTTECWEGDFGNKPETW